jgi:hypothetical protein
MTKKVSVVAALAAVVMLGIASSASAVILFQESFNYPGGSLDTSSGGVWGGGGTTTVDAGVNLTYPGYPNGGGGSGSMAASTNTPATVASNAQLSTIDNVAGRYYGALLMLGEVDHWTRLPKVIIKHQTAEFANIMYGETPLVNTGVLVGSGPDNGADLVVFQIDSDGGAGGETVKMIANPDPGSMNPADIQALLDAATAYNAADFTTGAATYFQFSRAPRGSPVWFDEIIYATKLGEVIPEPASMTLLAMGGLAMLRRRR